MKAENIRYKHFIMDSLRSAQSWADYIEDAHVGENIWRTIQSCIEEVSESFN